MKIKFNSYDNPPLNKILKLHILTIIVRSVFEEDGKYSGADAGGCHCCQCSTPKWLTLISRVEVSFLKML